MMSIGKKSRANTERHRKKVFSRDERCVVIGSSWGNLVYCGGPLTIQHRVTRGMGSSAKYDQQPNGLIAMCAVHNVLEPASNEFRKMCERSGWSVRRSIADRILLAHIPVRYPDGWYLLTGDKRVQIMTNTALEMMREIYGDEYDQRD
jgi:hypothetical protein